jgi:hypothetical protein
MCGVTGAPSVVWCQESNCPYAEDERTSAEDNCSA